MKKIPEKTKTFIAGSVEYFSVINRVVYTLFDKITASVRATYNQYNIT